MSRVDVPSMIRRVVTAYSFADPGHEHKKLPKFDLVLYFEQIEDGAAKRLVIWQRGTALRLERTDAETAKVIKQTIADRIKDRVPAPGSQEALRQMLDTGRAGNPNYDRMSPAFAQAADGKVYGFSEASATADKRALV